MGCFFWCKGKECRYDGYDDDDCCDGDINIDNDVMTRVVIMIVVMIMIHNGDDDYDMMMALMRIMVIIVVQMMAI